MALVCVDGSGDAQDAVTLLLVVVEGLLKQDRDGGWGLESCAQPDLPVLDTDLLDHRTHTHTHTHTTHHTHTHTQHTTHNTQHTQHNTNTDSQGLASNV